MPWGKKLYKRGCKHRFGRFPAGSLGLIVSDMKSLFWHQNPKTLRMIPHSISRSHHTVSRQPPTFHLIGHRTVPSTCCLGQKYPRVEYTLCPSRSARPWRITSRRISSRIHQPSISPVTSSCFFVGKKDGGLRPCIDYCTPELPDGEAALATSLGHSHPRELAEPASSPSWTCGVLTNLIRIREGNEPSCHHATPAGHYECQVTDAVCPWRLM